MGYRIFSFGNKSQSSESMEFEEAAMMAKEGLDKMCELAEEMKDQYGERRGRGSYGSRYGMRGGDYGGRGGYGNRYGERDEWEDMDDYGERRRRDSRGRYM